MNCAYKVNLFLIAPFPDLCLLVPFNVNINSLEKVPQDLFHSVYFEYEENSTHDRLLSLNYAFCHIKRLIKTSEPVYTD